MSSIVQLKKDIQLLKSQLEEVKINNINELKTEIQSSNLLYNKDIKELKDEINELKEIIHSLINDKKLEDNKLLYNKDNNIIKKDISEIKRFIKILMGEKFNFYDYNSGLAFTLYNKNYLISKDYCPLFNYLNNDILLDYLKPIKNNFCIDGTNPHPGNYKLSIILNDYFKKNPINWDYIKNYYKLEI